jgi:hypothetical protein
MRLWDFSEVSEEYRQAASGMEMIWYWFWEVCEKKEYDVDQEASNKELIEWVTADEDNDSDVYEIIADGEMWHYIDVEMGYQDMGEILSDIVVTTGPNVPILGHQHNGLRYEDGNEWGFGELYFLDRDKIIAWVEKTGMGGVNLSNLINWG